MQSVNGKIITLTKGDTFKATIVLTRPDGTIYTPEDGDTIRFAMKQSWEDQSVLLERAVPIDTMLLKLDPGDTSQLEVGNYVYDLQLTYSNGDVDTFIDKGTLKLTEEVS